ncbi:MAG TPA: MFS transporter [Candidatus Hydrogenedentes bacterium]|nr:MFS transporter [Candidatus Hydrogenedentota bacterium]HIJ74141.1 MFS transporter [Candidatus Hydrogenedentota bacterium]
MAAASTDIRMREDYKKGFWPLIVTQFQGAFSDNLLKFVIVFYLLDYFEGTAMESHVTVVTMALFTVPFILFPVYAGALADRFSKQRIAVWTKCWEFLVMSLVVVAFLFGNPYFLWGVLFLMTMQSTFFSPAKYGILPEILPDSRLSWGNGLLGMGTFVAIILGSGFAGPLMDIVGERLYLVGIVLVALAGIGLVSAVRITRPPAAEPRKRVPVAPWGGMGQYFRFFRADRWLMLTMLGIAFFWFAGSVVQQNVVELAQAGEKAARAGAGAVAETVESAERGGQALERPSVAAAPARMSEGGWTRMVALFRNARFTKKTLLQTAVALGIALGSLAAGYLSAGRIEVGLIPLGALGLTISNALMAVPGFGYSMHLLLLFLVGASAGFFVIPLLAVLQQRSPNHVKGGLIATSNFVSSVGMGFGVGLFFLLFTALGLSPQAIFLVAAIMTFVAAAYICCLLPMFLFRFMMWCLGHSIYRLKVFGAENIPEKGGALLIANHTSFIDAFVITASTDRLVRFVMFQGMYDLPWIKPFAKLFGAIPVAATNSPRELLESLKTATKAVESGEIVCIFAEGQITRTGQILPFRKGFERIMKGLDAPIIPVHLDRLWGSIFSFAGGKFFWKAPRRIPYPVTVSYGRPMASTAKAFEVRNAIQELGTEAYKRRRQPLLHRAFIKTARRHPFRFAIADGRTPKMTFLKALAGSIVLARKFHRLLGAESYVGVLIPPSVGAALTNVALQIMGKVPVNLNYTASTESVALSAAQCGITHVVTSREFLEKMPVDVPGTPVFIEDVKETVRGADRFRALLSAMFSPIRFLERSAGAPSGRSPQDLATVIFSSGSEGEPKGVMLTHFNVASNIEAALQVFPFVEGDCVMGILPFFHSFGHMATLWLPLVSGFSSVQHPNPLESRAVGALVHRHHATFLFATSTFLQQYVRRCTPEQFSSLKFVVAGAEKLAERVREAFTERFGIEPVEGYGTTECSPVVSVNVPDFRAPGFYQKGHKPGTIGRPIPGVSVRIVDPDTGDLMPEGEPGMLLVRGPNIMKGYLNKPEKTAAVLKDGWYETGDIAKVDEDGFITITDRLSRFSKISGEMVSHTRVEEALHALLGLSEQSLAVAGLPDPSKGERIVALHTLDDGQLDELLGNLDQSGLPNLWLPRPSAFYRIDEIPVLGTGKMDLKRVKALAHELAGDT